MLEHLQEFVTLSYVTIPRAIRLYNCFINVLQIAALFTRFQHLRESINDFPKQNLEEVHLKKRSFN